MQLIEVHSPFTTPHLGAFALNTRLPAGSRLLREAVKLGRRHGGVNHRFQAAIAREGGADVGPGGARRHVSAGLELIGFRAW